jgi:eukaryotic-like serine/threonine-protein kinase
VALHNESRTVNEPRRHDPIPNPRREPPPEEPKLRLADTDAGDEGNAATRRLPAVPGRTEQNSVSAAESLTSLEADSGRSTSGFETMLGKIVVDRGLITPEELDLCNALVQESVATESPRMLPDVLVDNSFVTQRQLTRLRTEFEADKSSQKIPGYRILKKLGSGAMATVFLAKQLSLDRYVAIKVLPKKFSTNEKFIERFYKEGRAAARLNDQNIVGAYDVGKAGEHHYFVMEYVDGDTVYDRIVAKKRFSESEAIDVVKQVASALKHAHQQGFIHRDIKPKNIMISRSGVVKLADLGLARAMSDKEAAEAESGRAYGTPYYISPEQIRGEVHIGPQADVYGLGATFYHMVTGRVPYEGRNPSEVMHRHLKAELTPPDHINTQLSAGCAQVIEMMLTKNPKDRYQSAKDLLTDLDLVRNGEPPHFARPKLDLASIVTANQPGQGAAAPTVVARASSASNPTMMFVVTSLVVSLVTNLVLLLVMLSS